MSKAEEEANKRYGITRGDDTQETSGIDMQRASDFIDGYRQAEKELIDKAIRWIKEINTHHFIMRYSDSCEPPLSELIEWFKNYMKEENINSK